MFSFLSYRVDLDEKYWIEIQRRAQRVLVVYLLLVVVILRRELRHYGHLLKYKCMNHPNRQTKLHNTPNIHTKPIVWHQSM